MQLKVFENILLAFGSFKIYNWYNIQNKFFKNARSMKKNLETRVLWKSQIALINSCYILTQKTTEIKNGGKCKPVLIAEFAFGT